MTNKILKTKTRTGYKRDKQWQLRKKIKDTLDALPAPAIVYRVIHIKTNETYLGSTGRLGDRLNTHFRRKTIKCGTDAFDILDVATWKVDVVSFHPSLEDARDEELKLLQSGVGCSLNRRTSASGRKYGQTFHEADRDLMLALWNAGTPLEEITRQTGCRSPWFVANYWRKMGAPFISGKARRCIEKQARLGLTKGKNR